MTKKFNIRCFVISTIIVGGLTFISLLAAASIDEGNGEDNILIRILAVMYHVFRFPTHTFFNEWINGMASFLLGLMINSIFYSFLIERLFTFLTQKNADS